MAHWAAPYLGRPYAKSGEGPDAFNCWSFFRWIQGEVFGIEVPSIATPEALLASAKSFREHPERRRWSPVEKPLEGDAVLLRRARYPIHIGVWTGTDGGKVVHCCEANGVEAPALSSLIAGGWRVEGFYRFVGTPQGAAVQRVTAR